MNSDFTVRAAAVTASALLHVLVYGALSFAPAWTPPTRPPLVITDLVIDEPTLAPAPASPVRTQARPKSPKRTIAKPHVSPTPAPPEPTLLARADAEPPVSPTPPAAASPVTAPPAAAPPVPATPAPTPPSATASDAMPASSTAMPASGDSSPAAPDGTLRAAGTPVAGGPSRGSAPAVASLPPASLAGTSGPVTRMAIPRGGYQITPSYPASARRLGIEGTALLRVFVERDGHVGDVVVKQSAGHPDLDRAAADAVRRWRFEPARRGADSVAMWVELPVDFRLR